MRKLPILILSLAVITFDQFVHAAPKTAAAAEPAEDDTALTHAKVRVIDVRRGWVFVETARPLKIGDRFIILSQRPIKIPDPVAGDHEQPSNKKQGLLVIER